MRINSYNKFFAKIENINQCQMLSMVYGRHMLNPQWDCMNHVDTVDQH